MTVNRHMMPAVAIFALLAVVFVTRLTGDWIVSGKEIPLGDMTAADIKGWMTLEQISDNLDIPMADLYRLAGIPEGSDVPPTTAMKDLEGLIEGFETSLLREAVEAYQATGALPEPAQAAPAAAPEPAAAATTALEATAVPAAAPAVVATAVPAVEATPTPHVPAAGGTGDGTGTGPTPLPPGQVLPANQIKGRMTLQEIATQCAVPLPSLLEALKLPASTNPNTQAKALVEAGQVAEVSAIQEAVAALQAAK